MYKNIVVGGVALLAAFAMQPAAAQANPQIGIMFGEGWSPAQYYPNYDAKYYPDYDDEDEYDEDYISCSEGRRIVRQHGFRQVSPIRCGGEVYKYRAVRRHRLWIVRVSARSGRIISARVISGYGGYGGYSGYGGYGGYSGYGGNY
jgi:hypothetical protein